MKDLSLPVRVSQIDKNEDGCYWKVVVNFDYNEALSRAGFDSFQSYFDLPTGTVVKSIETRSIVRFEISGSVFFLKRHEREKQQTIAQPQSLAIPYCSEGGKEFSNLCAFRRNGLATAIPVAMGESIWPDGTVESFLLTEDFSPFVQLEYIIRNTPSKLAGPENIEKRGDILRAVACYARKMHDKGFNHQDFNATHLLLSDVEGGLPSVALFDLQRVDQNRLQKFRWPIKALAEFNYSSLENDIFSDAERLFLFRIYRKKEQGALSLFERFQWALIRLKTKRIAIHTAKIHARKRISSDQPSSPRDADG